jgi:hypothetical protein
MHQAKQHRRLGRSSLIVAVIVMIALVLALSIAITTGAGHGFDQSALALPIFFVLSFLATWIGDWLRLEDAVLETKPRLFTSPSRAPPVCFSSPAHS